MEEIIAFSKSSSKYIINNYSTPIHCENCILRYRQKRFVKRNYKPFLKLRPIEKLLH